jgi:hypothetical protein
MRADDAGVSDAAPLANADVGARPAETNDNLG